MVAEPIRTALSVDKQAVLSVSATDNVHMSMSVLEQSQLVVEVMTDTVVEIQEVEVI